VRIAARPAGAEGTARDTAWPGDTAWTAPPRRALIVSGTVGEGHNAAGHAIAEAIGRLWPQCDIRWVDTCKVMGPGAGPLWRAIYVFNVEKAPWFYEFVYRSYWQRPWFADLSKRFIGSWAGRPMAKLLKEYQPDLIITTFPFGSSAMSWLRRHRGLETPVGAWVPDFCPHPFWVFRNLDVTYVMHERAVPVAAAADPGAQVAVAKPPVRSVFVPRDRDTARKELGLPQDRFVALVSAGSYGFGGVEECVTALLEADPGVHVVVACGRNERLLRRLGSHAASGGRLTALGWVDDMPTRIAAADVVLGNAGGATALEAIACGRPVVMFDPIAAHGRANAELMAEAGVAILCRTPADLRATVGRLARDPDAMEPLRRRAMQAAADGTPSRDDLLALAACRGQALRGPVPLRAEDAVVFHTRTPETQDAGQQVGALLVLEAAPLRVEDFRAVVRERLAGVPELRRRLQPARERWLRPCWITDSRVDVDTRIRQVTLGEDGIPAALDELVEAFFSEPCDPYRAPWEMLLACGVDGGRTAVVMKAHQMLGSDHAIIAALGRLFDPPDGLSPGNGHADGIDGNGHARGNGYRGGNGLAGLIATGPGPIAGGRGARSRLLAGARNAVRAMRGLGHVAVAGFAPATGPGGPLTGAQVPGTAGEPAAAGGPAAARRRYVSVTLPAPAVAATAQALRAGTSDLLLAVVAESLSRLPGRAAGDRSGHVMLRVTVSRPLPAVPSWRSGSGPAILALDLPTGPMTAEGRLMAVRRQVEARMRRGEAEAETLVLRAMDVLPAPLQRIAAVRIGRRWLSHPRVSILPDSCRRHQLLGARIEQAYPVLAPADGTGLAVGVMPWRDSMSIGILADTALVGDASALADGVRGAFRCFEAAAGRHGQG